MSNQNFKFKIRIFIEPDDGGYHAYCPELKGFHAAGDTEKEALKNAKDAAYAYLGSLIKHNEPIPLGVMDHEIEPSFSTIISKWFSQKPTQYIEEVVLAA